MSTVSFNQIPIDMINPINWNDFFGAVASSSHSSTHWSATNAATGGVWQFTGTGFGSYQSNIPFSGIITALTYAVNGVTLFSVSGASASEITFLTAGLNGDWASAVAGLYPGAETVNGTVGADRLYGFAGNDTLNGGDGNDTIDGGVGNDTLDGGDGNDTFTNTSGNPGVDSYNGGNGVDLLYFSGGPTGVTLNVADMSTDAGTTLADGTFIRNVESVRFTGGAGDDTLIISAFGPAGGQAGFSGGAGIDTFVADVSSSTLDLTLHTPGPSLVGDFANYYLDPSVEQFHLTTGSGNDYLRGREFADIFSGGAGNDTLDGGDGNDTLNGGDGNDVLTGGAGVDIMNGGDGSDTFTDGSGGDQLDGGAGINSLTLHYAIDFTGNVVFSLAQIASGLTLADGTHFQNFEQATLYTGSGNDVFDATGATGNGAAFHAGFGTDRLIIDLSSATTGITLQWQLGWVVTTGLELRTSSVEEFYVTGGSAVDDLDGGEGGDRLLGGGAGDFLDGRAGNDHLEGGTGDDVLQGGAGINELLGDSGDDSIISIGAGDSIDGGDGNDIAILNRTTSTVDFNIDTGDLMSSAWATLSDGTMVRNVERFTVVTGSGSDTFVVSSVSGLANILDGGAGTDRVIADFSSAVSAVMLTGISDSRTLTVGGFSLALSAVEEFHATGGAGNDRFDGADGDDILIGGSGNDTLQGGGGANVLDGGVGNDSIAAAGIDNVDGGDGFDFVALFRGGAGLNFAFDSALMASNGGQTLADGSVIRNVEQVQAYSGSGNDTMTFGGTIVGENSFQAGSGDDRLIVDLSSNTQTVSMNGSDSILGYAGSFRIFYNSVEHMTVYGGQANDHLLGSFNADTFFGNAGADLLEGLSGDDVLNGGAGDDTLDGGQGADALNGGDGNDIFVVDSLSDQVVEGASAGTDQVRASVNNYTLTANVEALLLLGSTANGFGNELANTLAGNAAANILSGQGGADTINAGAGSDTLFGGDGDDTLNGEGDADLLDGGNNNDALNGGDGLDTLYARAGNDVLNGGNGADVMYGGAGDDTYVVDDAGDLTVENSASGIDTVQASITFGLNAYIENLTLTGAAAINGIGNILANTLTGNDAANTLSGAAGFDVLDGLGGNDILNGGNGNDTLSGGAGNDVLDGGNNDDTEFGGDGADTLYGRTQNDTLSGDAGSDTLWGGDGDDVLSGGADNDQLDGGNHNDTLSGGDGDDSLYGRQNDDTLNGDAGADTLYGGDGDDFLNGGDNADHLEGGNGVDAIVGGDDDDVLLGQAGNDTIAGGDGNDIATGGAGDDSFVFTPGGGSDADVVTDFAAGGTDDTLDFSALDGTGVTWSINQVSGDTVFTFSNGDSLTLNNVNMNNLVVIDSWHYG